MFKVLSDAFVAADTGQAAFIGLLDLTGAFDTVDHAIVIERLRLKFGVVDSALHWSLDDVVSDRSNAVCPLPWLIMVKEKIYVCLHLY